MRARASVFEQIVKHETFKLAELNRNRNYEKLRFIMPTSFMRLCNRNQFCKHLCLLKQNYCRRSVTLLLMLAYVTSQLACGGGSSSSGGGGVFGGGSGSSGDSTATTTTSSSSSAQLAPHFRPGFNLFSPADDVKLGQQSAQEMASQLPLMRDAEIVNYVRGLGAKLARFAPGEKYPYQFNVVGTREMNAFALPGGYVFVNAGAIIAAKNEAELAGVIAHEITHVALRHGTNQMSKAYIAKAGLGVLGTLAGAGSSPEIGSIVNVVGGAGANMLLLKFGRTAERQADIDGARIMAAAGYDPRDMANFFQTLQTATGGKRSPEFLSDHPDPGNRVAAIEQELKSLRIASNPTHDTAQFQNVKARLSGGRGSSNANLQSDVNLNRTGPRDPSNIPNGARPALPSTTAAQFNAPDSKYSLQVPSNWRAASRDNSNIIIAPEGGYGAREQSTFVTHGLFVGTLRTPSVDLRQATRALVEQQLEANPDYQVGRQSAIQISGQQALATIITGPSSVSGVREVDVMFTAITPGGELFYLVAICPEDELNSYQTTFERVVESVRFNR